MLFKRVAFAIRSRAALPWLALGAALALLYLRLLAGRVLANGDLHLYFFPYWSAAARAFQAGTLPLWNPMLFAGAPLLANSQVGVFYPLNWPLWWLSGPTLAGATRTLHVSVLLHLGVAACNTVILARRLGAGRWGAAVAGLLYAGGGFLGVHVEHLNQLHGLAWLPLVLLPAARLNISPLNVLAFAMILLAGHTQTAFIAAVGAVVFYSALWMLQAASSKRQAASSSKPQVLRFTQYAVRSTQYAVRITQYASRFIPFTLAALIAAPQLWPTLELSHFSMRAGGLPWREAVSFSLVPWEAHRALLPAYLVVPLLPEGVAYLGLLGLALAGWGAWRAWRARSPQALALAILAGVGLFLALGAYNPLYLLAARLGLPGVAQFRAPARFLALYALGAALLAGMGLHELLGWLGQRPTRAPLTPHVSRFTHYALRITHYVIFLILTLELFLSAARLPHTHATDPRAYTDLRPATAHLVAAARAAPEGEPPGRFLSISQGLFDPGDKATMEAIYQEALSFDALWQYLVAAKHREVLTPNLPLAFDVHAVDGYDGGLLPLRHYAAFTRLLLPEGTLDGRLRENLQTIPEGRWLSLLGVRFLITDKTGDAWSDGVFYDRQFQPALAPGEALTLAWLPDDFAADALGLLYAGDGAVELGLADGPVTLALPAATEETAHRARWDTLAAPRTITLRAGDAGLTLFGASLLDEHAGAFYPLTLSDRFRLAHSGDVKIYENLVPLPRAFLVHRIHSAPDDATALALLAAPDFDPAVEAVVQGGALPGAVVAVSPGVRESARVTLYTPTRIEVEVHAAAAGLLLLTDAWYPAWQVTVAPLDGSVAPVAMELLRANVLFRAVPVQPGAWRVTFTYRPGWLWGGPLLGVLGCLGLWGYWRKRACAAG